MRNFFDYWTNVEKKAVPFGLKIRLGRLANSTKSENEFFKTVDHFSGGMDSKTVFLKFGTGEYIVRYVSCWQSSTFVDYHFVEKAKSSRGNFEA